MFNCAITDNENKDFTRLYIANQNQLSQGSSIYESKKNVAGVAATSLLNKFPTNFGFEIEIYKNIKAGSGIGSSAASSAGAVFGINELLGRPFSRKELIKFAMKGEELASGSIHADNVAPVLLGGFTLVRDINSLDIVSLPFPKNLFVSIIHPEIELKTSDSRSVLKQKVTCFHLNFYF